MLRTRCWGVLVVLVVTSICEAQAPPFRNLQGVPAKPQPGFSVLPPGQMAQPSGVGAVPFGAAGNLNQQGAAGNNAAGAIPGLNSPLWPGLNSANQPTSPSGMSQNQLNPSASTLQALSAYNAMQMNAMQMNAMSNPYMNPYMANPYFNNPYLNNPYMANPYGNFGPTLPQAMPGWGLGNAGAAPIVGINNMNANNGMMPNFNNMGNGMMPNFNQMMQGFNLPQR